MGIRITVMLDDDIVKKLGVLQAKKLKNTSKAVIFSGVINEVLSKHL